MRALLALALVVTSAACGGHAPAVIRDELARTRQTSAGSATVVVFTDFQCPFCRRTHAALAPALDARPGRVRVVVRHVPLPRHPDAGTAARASVCVERLAPAVSASYDHALYTSFDLSEAACTSLAVARGLDAASFGRCLGDPATDARLAQDLAMFDAVGGDGVPLLYVGGARLEGAQTANALAAAIDDALSGT